VGMCLRAITLCLAVLLNATGQSHQPQNFLIHTLSGAPVNVTQYAGKVVIIEFLLTTCPHCQHVATLLKKLQLEYGPERLQVLGCAVEESAPARVGAFVAQFDPPFPVGFADRNATNAYLEHDPKALLKMPQVVFIDKAGVKRATYVGDDPFFAKDDEANIRKQIDKLSREAVPISRSR
jgi:thiol-disulfide isomerase/thioredoxin